MLWTLAKEVLVGDRILCPDGNGFYHVAEVVGDYYYAPEKDLIQLAEKDQIVRGVVFALEDDKKLRRALITSPNIAFYRYQVDFKLLEA